MDENRKNVKTFILSLFFYALSVVTIMAVVSWMKQNRVDLSSGVVALLTVIFINIIKLYGTRKKKILEMMAFIEIKHNIKLEHGQLDPTEDFKNKDRLAQYKKYSWISLNMFILYTLSLLFMVVLFPGYIPLGILSACLGLIPLEMFIIADAKAKKASLETLGFGEMPSKIDFLDSLYIFLGILILIGHDAISDNPILSYAILVGMLMVWIYDISKFILRKRRQISKGHCN